VTVNKARFVVVAQTDWRASKTGESGHGPLVAPIDIQLQITNVGGEELLFPTSRAFGIKIWGADGKEVASEEVERATVTTGSIILETGLSYSISRRADLRWDEKTKAAKLIFHDGSGSQTSYGPLSPGRYKLAFWYAARRDERKDQKPRAKGSWVGEVVTESVLINLMDATTRGFAKPKHAIANTTSPIRIRESKPVTVNDAKFVTVTQSEWRVGAEDERVPIEIQLRITNVGTADLAFPTFDTFGLIVLDKNGAKVPPRAGRNLTTFGAQRTRWQWRGARLLALTAGAFCSGIPAPAAQNSVTPTGPGPGSLSGRLHSIANIKWHFGMPLTQLAHLGSEEVQRFGTAKPKRRPLRLRFCRGSPE
jgi:hypothetical protein